MMLSDATIKEYIALGKIVVFPELDPVNIRPAGIRLHLGSEVLVPVDGQTIDPDNPVEVNFENTALLEGFLLKPGMFILGTTLEKIRVDRSLLCHIDGRSTLARLGLSIHCESQTVDGNYEEPRSVVLEIKNHGNFNIILKSNMPVAMLLFSELSEPVSQGLQSQYRGQTSVIGPNLKFRRN